MPIVFRKEHRQTAMFSALRIWASQPKLDQRKQIRLDRILPSLFRSRAQCHSLSMPTRIQDAFILFGDSITQFAWEPNFNGVGQRLSHVYARKLDVLNRGYSGYNTDWALPVYEQFLPKRQDTSYPKVRALTIWFGANDACIEPSPQHVPLDKFKSNLKRMVNMLASTDSPYYSPDTKVFLLTPPPVNTHQRLADLQSRDPPLALDRLFEVTKQYAQAVREVGVEVNVPVVDVWTLFWKAVGEDEKSLSRVLIDGLHLNELGYELVFKELVKTIGDKYPELHYDSLPPVFPFWADINWKNPSESLYVSGTQ